MNLGHLLLEVEAPGTHPTIGTGFWAVNYDSLISSGLAIIVTLIVGFYVASRVSNRRPGKLQVIFELLNDYVAGLIHESVGEGNREVTRKAQFVMPIALTIFFYILVANWLDALPLTGLIHPANADLNQTLAMAMVVFLIVQWYTFREQGLLGYLKRMTRPFEMNPFVRALFVPLNLIEDLVKPVTLSLRLFGNIFAGTVMVFLLTTLVASIPVAGNFLSPVLVAGWKVFDVFLIGSIQAFIFMLLTVIYFGQAREGMHHQHSGPEAAAATH